MPEWWYDTLVYPCLEKIPQIEVLESKTVLELIRIKDMLVRNSERQEAHFWYDTQESKIKDKLNRTWTETIGGKSFTFHAANQRFFEPEVRKEFLGEDVEEQGTDGGYSNPDSFTQNDGITEYYKQMLEKGITSGTLGDS